MLCLPPMLILDEATSSIDTRTELMVQEAFDRLMEGRTSFIVAHRLSTIRNADEILVMKDGSIIEQGSHDNLMAKGGFYQNLYNSQFVKVSESFYILQNPSEQLALCHPPRRVFFLGFIYLTEGLLSSFFFIFLCSQIFFCECYCITDTVRTTSEDFTCLYAF